MAPPIIRTCARCKLTSKEVELHPCDDFLCVACAKYNDDCLKKRIMPAWELFLDELKINRQNGKQGSCTRSKNTDNNQSTSPNCHVVNNTSGGSLGEPTSTAPDPSVTLLPDLLTVDQSAQAFVNSLNVIYSYNGDSIHATLDKLSMETLKTLYNLLWEKMVCEEQFNMKDCRPKMRQVKHTIIRDVYHFGLSIVNGLLSDETRKAYLIPQGAVNHLESGNNELDNLLKIVMDLQTKHKTLEKELQTKTLKLEKDIAALRTENNELRQFMSAQVPRSPSNPTAAECSSLTSDMRDAPTSAPIPLIIDGNQGNLSSAGSSRSSSSSSSSSSDIDADDANEEAYRPPAHYAKKLRRLERKVHKLSSHSGNAESRVTAKGGHRHQKLTAAPMSGRESN